MTEMPTTDADTQWDAVYGRLADLAAITHPAAWTFGRGAESVTITPPENDRAGRAQLAALSQYHHWSVLKQQFAGAAHLDHADGHRLDPIARRRYTVATDVVGALDYVYRLLVAGRPDEAKLYLPGAIADAKRLYTELIEPYAAELKPST